MNDYSKILKAVAFAADKHKNQRRKGENDTPYINHPIQVAELLAEIGNIEDLDLLQAAILHDTVEDTKTSEAEIIERFGVAVAKIVMEVTDDKSLPKMERKQLQIDHAAKKSPQAQILKIADKTCNVRDIVLHPPNWETTRKVAYLDWAEAVVNEVRGVNTALEDYFDEWLKKGRKEFG